MTKKISPHGDLISSARQLVTDSPNRQVVEQLGKAELDLISALDLVKRRMDWLAGFGKLAGLCGLPPENSADRDLPLPTIALSGLLAAYEFGAGPNLPLEDTPATLSYLLLKSASLRGKPNQMPEMEQMFERWGAGMEPVIDGGVIDSSLEHRTKLAGYLLAWLNRWEFDVCECIVLDALAKSRPSMLSGTQYERLAELQRKLPARVRLPSRQGGFVPARIRINGSLHEVQGEIENDIASNSQPRVYLLRKREASDRHGGFGAPAGMSQSELLSELAQRLKRTLAVAAPEVSEVSVRIDVKGHLQEPRNWLQITPARAEENGLGGAAAWVDLELRSLGEDYPEVLWTIYHGADPSGLGLKAFLDLADAVRNDHEPILASLARDIDDGLRSIMGDYTKALRRAPMMSTDGRSKPV